MFSPDSYVAAFVSPSRGYRRGKYSERRSVAAYVVHTTGSGILRRWKAQGKRHGEATPFETALRVYGRLMDASPHYVVGQQEGQVAQVCPEHLAAWHVGSRNYRRYSRWKHPLRSSRYHWWRKEFPLLESPVELLDGRLWNGGSVNSNTLGVECVPPLDGEWSDAFYRNLQELLQELDERHQATWAVTHSVADPVGRTNKFGPWDLPLDVLPAKFSVPGWTCPGVLAL